MTQITPRVHSIEGITHPDPRGKVFPYLFVEDQDNLTLIDPSFLSQLPILENYLLDVDQPWIAKNWEVCLDKTEE
jgi:hypothetical protein